MWRPDKRVIEKEMFAFNYNKILIAMNLAITVDVGLFSAVWRIEVDSGVDPSPMLMLAEGPYIVYQTYSIHKVVGGVPDTLYHFYCDGTLSDGQIITLDETLWVR